MIALLIAGAFALGVLVGALIVGRHRVGQVRVVEAVVIRVRPEDPAERLALAERMAHDVGSEELP